MESIQEPNNQVHNKIPKQTNPQTIQITKNQLHQSAHGKNIIHTGENHPHHHHVDPPLVIQISDLIDPIPYLMAIYKMKQKVDSYYMQNCQAYVDYWKKQYGIQFTLDGYQLINYDVVINMEEFLKQNWVNVEYIGFAGCKIDDLKWRMFVEHAHLFPNLKWISLQIKHTMNIKEGDLEVFKSLKRIQFTYEQWTHPLTIPGKTYLKKFAKDHPHIQVVFG